MLVQVVTGAALLTAVKRRGATVDGGVVQAAGIALRPKEERVGDVAVRRERLLRVLHREAEPHLVAEVLESRGSRIAVPS